MDRADDRCDPILMERYFDHELNPEDRARAEAHLTICPACRRLLEKNRLVAEIFRSDPAAVLTEGEKAALEVQVLARASRHSWDVWDWLKAKRLVPLAAATALLVAVFSYLLEPAPPSGPSAIVNSFQGDVSSVVILETPDNHNTIIWFVETT